SRVHLHFPVRLSRATALRHSLTTLRSVVSLRRGAQAQTRAHRGEQSLMSCSPAVRPFAIPAVTRGTASRLGFGRASCANARGRSCFERATACQFSTNAMLRLGPLVVYPVEVTHLRGQHAPVRVDSGCESPRRA